jgi:hypothetical protein
MIPRHGPLRLLRAQIRRNQARLPDCLRDRRSDAAAGFPRTVDSVAGLIGYSSHTVAV